MPRSAWCCWAAAPLSSEFVHNGFKVGPNYQRPPAPLDPAWIDASNPRVKSAPADYSALVDRLRRPRAERPGPDRLRAERQPARGGDPRPGGAGAAGHRGRRAVPAAADGHRRVHAHPGEQEHRQRAAAPLLRRLGDRPQRLLGDRLLGQDPPHDRVGGRRGRGLGGRLRQRDGHAHRRRGDRLRAVPHLRAADRLRPGERPHPARLAEDRHGALEGRADQRAAAWSRRASLLRAAGGDDPRAGNRPAAGEQPALRPARHAAGRVGRQARAKRPFPTRRRRSSWAFRPTSSAGGRTSARPSG